ncbi:MAG: hypothetical protein ABTS22_06865, partial [Accumulibacter sp.]
MTIYLCTCGTSAAKNLPRESHFDAAWVEAHGGIESATTVVHASFQTYRAPRKTGHEAGKMGKAR